ncbi:MAG: 4Fe-4S binding protein [Candidatus Eisenbacteria bacterium]
MAVRKLITIDEDKCDGCGLCATACHEGAIQLIDGKAKLVSESYCDGLGDCLGECPRDAITIVEREAADYDQTAVDTHLARMAREKNDPAAQAGGGCPGAALRSFDPQTRSGGDASDRPSRLGQWPVLLNLVPPNAPFLKGEDLLISADCVAYATANFHEHYLAGKTLVVGCPKFDDVQHYYEKLKAMFLEARPRSITVTRMQVPCCGGLSNVVTRARNETVPDTGLSVVTIGIRGEELSVEAIPPPA